MIKTLASTTYKDTIIYTMFDTGIVWYEIAIEYPLHTEIKYFDTMQEAQRYIDSF